MCQALINIISWPLSLQIIHRHSNTPDQQHIALFIRWHGFHIARGTSSHFCSIEIHESGDPEKTGTEQHLHENNPNALRLVDPQQALSMLCPEGSTQNRIMFLGELLHAKHVISRYIPIYTQ